MNFYNVKRFSEYRKNMFGMYLLRRSSRTIQSTITYLVLAHIANYKYLMKVLNDIILHLLEECMIVISKF